jgi:hypothetical protein
MEHYSRGKFLTITAFLLNFKFYWMLCSFFFGVFSFWDRCCLEPEIVETGSSQSACTSISVN